MSRKIFIGKGARFFRVKPVVSINSILGNKKTAGVVDDQWGDSGKGKVIDLLADWAEIIERVTGGPNAGHTVHIDGRVYILHQIQVGY